jgi:hypothetical protein
MKRIAKLLILSALSSTGVFPAVIYNAVNDFTLSQNPNGVWAYGSNSGAGGAFEAFTYNLVDTYMSFWGQSVGAYPVVGRNNTGATYTDGTYTLLTDELNLDPGATALSAILQFTAPVGGSYSFTGEFLGHWGPFTGYPSGTTSEVRADINGTDFIAATALTGTNTIAINHLANLLAGDKVSFRVSTGAVANFADSTGLRLIVEGPDVTPPPTGEVPEPSTFILLGGGLAAIAIKRRKRG